MTKAVTSAVETRRHLVTGKGERDRAEEIGGGGVVY